MAQNTAYRTAARSSSHTTNRIIPPDYPWGVTHFVVYTVMRLGLLLATFAVVSTVAVLVFGNAATVWLLAMIVAAVVSSALSLKLLAGPRERFAETVEARAARAKGKFEELRSREDAD
jgi:uncharacterized membrane protein